MFEIIEGLKNSIEILNNSFNQLQYYLNLTWTIFAIIIAVIAFIGAALLRTWVNHEVNRRLKDISKDIELLQKSDDEQNKRLENMIESGTNANGGYIKFSDGTLICFQNQELSYSETMNSAEKISMAFPAAFHVDEFSGVVSVPNAIDDDFNSIPVSVENKKNIGVTVSLKNKQRGMIKISVISIGRWKKYM